MHEITQSASDMPSKDNILWGILWAITIICVLIFAIRCLVLYVKKDKYSDYFEEEIVAMIFIIPVVCWAVVGIYYLGVLIAHLF